MPRLHLAQLARLQVAQYAQARDNDLDAVARRLDTARRHLCRSCKVLEVEESFSIGGK